MRLKFTESINLFNFLKRQKNKEQGKPDHYGLMNIQRLGMVIYPNASYQTIAVSMNKLIKGKFQKVGIDWVLNTCLTLHVTPNFLFGFDCHVTDKNYNLYLKSLKEKENDKTEK